MKPDSREPVQDKHRCQQAPRISNSRRRNRQRRNSEKHGKERRP